MLRVTSLATSYGGIEALRGVNLHVPKGEMRALIGANGAGKSTLLNTVSGVLKPKAGSVVFDGSGAAGLPAHRIAQLGLLQVPEGRQILGPLSVEENLELGRIAARRRSGHTEMSLENIFSVFPILKERRQQMAASLSGGQQQMLAIGRALMGAPKLLLLDEPSLGLSPLMSNEVFASLQKLNAAGLSILVVEQNARRALASTSYAYVLERGRIVLEGPSAELASNSTVIAHYLGADT